MHGDDITTLGCDKDLDWLRDGLSKSFELKIRGRVGVGVEGSNDMRILNRIIEMTSSGITYESDPRHVDILTSAPSDCCGHVPKPALSLPPLALSIQSNCNTMCAQLIHNSA